MFSTSGMPQLATPSSISSIASVVTSRWTRWAGSCWPSISTVVGSGVAPQLRMSRSRTISVSCHWKSAERMLVIIAA